MQHTALKPRCFRAYKQIPSARIRMFCFPYGGAGPSVFRGWPDYFTDDIELTGILYPGRESRLVEPLVPDIRLIAESLLPNFLPRLDKPFAFFGHSMGALISFELTRLLVEQHDRAPQHLFVSGCGAPHIPDTDPIHGLPEDEFLDALVRLNGMPQEVLENKELLEYALPIIRADFTACASYRSTRSTTINCPITAYGGDQDSRVPIEDLTQWSQYTQTEFEYEVFTGDHFFLHEHEQRMLSVIQKTLLATS